jgi:hypothetical protein
MEIALNVLDISANSGNEPQNIEGSIDKQNASFLIRNLQARPMNTQSTNQSSKPKEDKAMVENSNDAITRGGVDLNPNKLNLEINKAGQGIQFNMDPAMIEKLQYTTGITPVIIDIRPMTETLRMFLGAKNEHVAAEQLSMR